MSTGEDDDVGCTQFSCLALLAHLLNERVVAHMQSAAKAGALLSSTCDVSVHWNPSTTHRIPR